MGTNAGRNKTKSAVVDVSGTRTGECIQHCACLCFFCDAKLRKDHGRFSGRDEGENLGGSRPDIRQDHERHRVQSFLEEITCSLPQLCEKECPHHDMSRVQFLVRGGTRFIRFETAWSKFLGEHKDLSNGCAFEQTTNILLSLSFCLESTPIMLWRSKCGKHFTNKVGERMIGDPREEVRRIGLRTLLWDFSGNGNAREKRRRWTISTCRTGVSGICRSS